MPTRDLNPGDTVIVLATGEMPRDMVGRTFTIDHKDHTGNWVVRPNTVNPCVRGNIWHWSRFEKVEGGPW